MWQNVPMRRLARYHADRLLAAELQFRLASAVRIAVSSNRQPLDLPIEWSHGFHRVTYDEIALSQSDADCAAFHLERTATFLLASEIRNAIIGLVRNPKDHRIKRIRSAYQIARLLRNAFAHSPFDPVWSVDRDCENTEFEVRPIISIDTTDLHQTRVDWRHYGGPLAVLAFARWVREYILKVPPTAAELHPQPAVRYHKFENLLVRRPRRSA